MVDVLRDLNYYQVVSLSWPLFQGKPFSCLLASLHADWSEHCGLSVACNVFTSSVCSLLHVGLQWSTVSGGRRVGRVNIEQICIDSALPPG